MKNKFLFLFCIFTFAFGEVVLQAQNLQEILQKEALETPQYEIATFKGTRIALGQSVENWRKGVLQFAVMNRYWNLPESEIQSFAADKLSARFGLEYAFTDRLSFGGGWTSLEDVSDVYFKYNLLREQVNTKKAPFSISFFQNATYRGDRSAPIANADFTERLAFTSQFLIAKKLNHRFSLQLSPTFIYRNATGNDTDPNTHFALGFGGRYNAGGHVALVSEYYYVLNPLESRTTYGAFALGVNWDVRFLLLQFQLTNARSMVEDGFILQTPNNFNTKDGNLVFGFNAIFSFHTLQKTLKTLKKAK